MPKMPGEPPPEWGTRFREYVRAKKWKWAKVAEMTGWTEPTIRSWTNGTRKINLDDFFILCRKTKADPAEILFGGSTLNPSQQAILRRVAKEFGDSLN